MIDVKRRAFAGVVLAGALLVAGCNSGGGGSGADATAPTDPANLTGDITVLTNRTDLVTDGSLEKYATEFRKVYPKVTVKFEAITDYEGEVKIRMNTKTTVTCCSSRNSVRRPTTRSSSRRSATAAELSKTSTAFTDTAQCRRQGLRHRQHRHANGFVYNKDVWKQAGVTTWPTTPERVPRRPLQAIKAKTGVTPYYTNYKDGWPLSPGSTSSARSAATRRRTTSWPPPTPVGRRHRPDRRRHAAVRHRQGEAHRGGPDAPPTGRSPRACSATGKIGTMWLGSWAIVQMQDAAKKAGKDPTDRLHAVPAQADGKFCSVVGAGLQERRSTSTPRTRRPPAPGSTGSPTSPTTPPTARAVSARQGRADAAGAARPADGRRAVHRAVPGRARRRLTDRSTTPPRSALGKPDYRQKIVDIARGAAKGDLNGIFADLNKKWTDTQAKTVALPRARGRGHARRPVAMSTGWPCRHRAAPGRARRTAGPPGGVAGTLTPWLSSLAPLALLVVFTYIPVGEHGRLQLHRLGRPQPRPRRSSGRQLRRDLFTRPGAVRVFFVSLYYLGASVVQIGARALLRHDPELQDPVPEPVQGHPVLPVPHQRRRDRRSSSCTSSSPAAPSTRCWRCSASATRPAVARRPRPGQLLPRRGVGVALPGPELRAVPRRDPVHPRASLRGRRAGRRQPLARSSATSSCPASGRSSA